MKLGVLGPRASEVVDASLDRLVLAGDETSLPAIGGWLSELPSGVSVRAVVEVADAGEQALPSAADVDVRWLHRDGVPAGASTLLADALADVEFEFPTGRGSGWRARPAATDRWLPAPPGAAIPAAGECRDARQLILPSALHRVSRSP